MGCGTARWIPLLCLMMGGAVNRSWGQSDRPYLLGDWNGARSRLERKGVVFQFQVLNDTLADGGGDLAHWGRVRGTMDADLSEYVWTGLRFHITGLWQGGGNLGSYIGSIANPSSLVSRNTTRLDSWWLEQSLLQGRVVVRAGQFAGHDSYGNQLSGGSYLLEPLGYAFGNLFANTRESFNPAATPAAEIKWNATSHLYFRTAVMAGNRDPYQQDTNGLHFRIKDSPVVATEAGYVLPSTTYGGTYRVGGIVNPGRFEDVLSGLTSRGNYLVYFLATQTVYRRGRRAVDVNFGIDRSPSDVSAVSRQTTAGVRMLGWLPHRSRDALSLGVVHSSVSRRLNEGSEQALEVNYAVQVTRWFVWQPVFQYYFHAGPGQGTSAVAGFRTVFTL